MGKTIKLSDELAGNVLRKYNIPMAKHILAKSENMAIRAANKLGYPVVLKIDSKDVIHKTETGGVLVDVRDDDEIMQGYKDIMKNVKKKVPEARIDGVLVQHMHDGREVIIGARRDPQFGPIIMFGLGGIFVEVMKDVSFRMVPTQPDEIREMITEIKGYPVLKGVRGQGPVNFLALERAALGVSKIMEENKNIQEMDINPLMVDEKGVVAVDVRIIENK